MAISGDPRLSNGLWGECGKDFFIYVGAMEAKYLPNTGLKKHCVYLSKTIGLIAGCNRKKYKAGVRRLVPGRPNENIRHRAR